MARYEEEELVVYYDLDADSRSRNLLLVPDVDSFPAQPRVAVAAPTKVAGEGSSHQIFPRQQQPLFNLDESGDEADEERNPFDSLLQHPTQQAAMSVTDKASRRAIDGRSHSDSLLAVDTGGSLNKRVEQQDIGEDSTFRSSGNGGNPRSILKGNQEPNGFTDNANTNSSKKLGFETADSRPARWSTRKPSPTDTKNRRKSLSAILKRRSQLEASAAKRRKSMPANMSDSRVAQNQSTFDDRVNGIRSPPRRRLLSDVLQRATMLSQQQQTTSDEASLSHQKTQANSTDGDVILDTEHHMRAERFAPQFFSPTKPASTTTALSRKLKGDAVISKIRGGIGDVIRKAIRKSNRELTLLRSHGQHLLPQQSSHSSPTTSIGAVESIQNRAYIVICLTRYCGILSHFAAYECRILQVSAKLENTTADELKEKHSVVLEAHFHTQTAEYLKLSPRKLLKVFEPLHFFPEHAAAGSVSKPKWFLVSTQLTQVVEGDHQCAERQEKRI